MSTPPHLDSTFDPTPAGSDRKMPTVSPPSGSGRRRGAALILWLRRRRFHLLALALSGLLFFTALEVVLRVMPPRLNPKYGNHVYSTYGSFPGGIYFIDEPTRMNFLRVSFGTENYWNGYRWRHQADEWGFRNAPGTESKEILILGDSLIYGHGVELEETAVDLLRTRHGRPAYNMARQGDSLYQHYLLLRLFLERFDPETVVLFAFLNDPDDLFFYRSETDILNPPELEEYDYDDLFERMRRRARSPDYGLRPQLERSRAFRLLRGFFHELIRAPLIARAEAQGEEVEPPRYVRAILDDQVFNPASRYYELVVADLTRRCRDRGTELILVHFDVGSGAGIVADRAQNRFQGLLEEVAAANGLELFSTQSLFAGCGSCFLPRDGHLSALGNARLSEFLDRVVLTDEGGRAPEGD